MADEKKTLTNIEEVTIENEMQTSYLDYSMSVIIGRAIPDIRDGLKPVHRRTLYSLSQTGTFYNKPYKKSARIVGDVIGKYHPHGDQAVYDTLVRMAQDFSLRYPLVDGQGNFGSIDGDPPAAQRYTEVRLQSITNELLRDLDKNTVNFIPNYDESLQEPEVFPSQLPNLLLNGSSGIAVGMATSIPPHNIKELTEAFIEYMDNPSISFEEIMNIVKGPDFPTGGTIFGKSSILEAYKTGKGSVIVRGKAGFEEDSKGKQKIIISEIPYQTNKSKLLETIAKLVNTKKIGGISDLRDESDRDGMRIVVEIKKDDIPEVVLNNLFKYTQLQSTFSLNLLAIVNQQPKQFNIKNYFKYFLGHRKEIVRRRTHFELEKAEKRIHIIEGLKIALANLDEIVKIIKGSKNRDEARKQIRSRFKLSEIQANAILEMQLYKLTGLEVEKLENEYNELVKLIKYLKEILSNEHKLLELIKTELIESASKFEDKRRTEIVESELTEINMEDIIKDEDYIIIFTKGGYIKRTLLDAYKIQNRGTMGKRGFGLKDDDMVRRVFVASAHEYILVFTEKGRMFWKKVYDLPEGDTTGRGKPINRIIGISDEEKVCSVINVKEFSEEKFVMMFSRKGYVKKTNLSKFARPRVSGIIAADVGDGDLVFEAHISSGNNDVILGSTLGKSIRFNEKQIREMGRGARGVIGMKLAEDDFLVGAGIIGEDDKYILTLTESGIGKKSALELYRCQSRSGKGLMNIKINEKLGKVIGLVILNDFDEIILSSEKGVVNKIGTSQIRSQGRATQGLKIVNLKEGDRLVSLEKVRVDESEIGDVEDERVE